MGTSSGGGHELSVDGPGLVRVVLIRQEEGLMGRRLLKEPPRGPWGGAGRRVRKGTWGVGGRL